MMDHEDEPFDSSSALPSLPVNKGKSGGAPPSAAFMHSGSGNGSSLAAAPPAAVSPEPAPAAAAAAYELPPRWAQHETEMDNHRNGSSLSNASSNTRLAEATRAYKQQEQQQKEAGIQRNHSTASSVASTVTPTKSTGSYSNYSLYNTPSPDARPSQASASGGLAARQGYSFKRSESYDTADLLRKYGGMTLPPRNIPTPPVPMTPPVPPPSYPSNTAKEDVRGQALRVLDLVDDHLDTPLDVRRTQSGGFRAAPALDYPYNVRRPASGRIPEQEEAYAPGRTGKRVPSALAGLSLNNSQPQRRASPPVPMQGRMSFTDPRFRDDDEMSFEDEILHKEDHFVDVVQQLESRGASSRPNDQNNQHFAGDFPNKAWSSRYSSASNQNQHSMGPNGVILDGFDRDHDRQRQSARNMFAASAHQVKNAMDNTSGRVFGSGFSFRQNQVFGSESPEKPQINLRTVWKDVDEDPTHPTTPRPVHKTWQTAMLNKRKRRRIIAIVLLGLAAFIVIIATSVHAANRIQASSKATAGAIGSAVTFYVTSDVPYGRDGETKLNKDLTNIAGDAEFIMHLGNIQDSTTLCPSTRYTDVASVLAKSPVPMFVLPGEEDYTKCPNPDKSLMNWLDAFVGFESNFKHPFDIYRQNDHPEEIAFLHNGVLFFGLHLVNGGIHTDDEQLQMLKFYFGMLNNQKDQYRAIVLMANARPSPAQQFFFSGVFTSLEINKPIAYIHANSGTGSSVQEYTPFEDHEEIFGIEIQNGGKNPPLKITIGFGERPFLVG
jgi:hypothetical protein